MQYYDTDILEMCVPGYLFKIHIFSYSEFYLTKTTLTYI